MMMVRNVDFYYEEYTQQMVEGDYLIIMRIIADYYMERALLKTQSKQIMVSLYAY